MMYSVVVWDTKEVLLQTSNINQAKRIARQLGYEPAHGSNGKYYAAFARVDGDYGTEYVPRFIVGNHDDKQVDFGFVSKLRRQRALAERKRLDYAQAYNRQGIANAQMARTQLKAWDWPGLK